jgi:hypothetical protein
MPAGKCIEHSRQFGMNCARPRAIARAKTTTQAHKRNVGELPVHLDTASKKLKVQVTMQRLGVFRKSDVPYNPKDRKATSSLFFAIE